MSKKKIAVEIASLPTGVPGLDEVLSGGLPELSFNLIAGEPGAGKTTLALQIAFANASKERPSLYFTVLGEPTIKLLRYQQQMRFFDSARVGDEIRFLNLSEEVLKQDLDLVFDRILQEVERTNPRIVIVDSFRTATSGYAVPAAAKLERFVQRLAVKLTSWQVTSFLVGEYLESELRSPVFTVADGTIWMTQSVDRNSVVRKLQVVKMRGRGAVPGLHTMRITPEGVRVFPRTTVRGDDPVAEGPPRRLSTGVPDLDDMMGGGVPAGDAVIFAGPTGTGKTTFATRFMAAGCEAGEAAVMVVFEERLPNFIARATRLGADVLALEAAERLRVLYVRPLDLSPEEILHEIREAILETGAKRVVIDSLSGFEVALAPTFRTDFRESLYRVVGALSGGGVTVLLTLETPGMTGTDLRFATFDMSFVADDIVVQRHVEIQGKIRKVLSVIKMRGSAHSNDLCEYVITSSGVQILGPLNAYNDVLSGAPRLATAPRADD